MFKTILFDLDGTITDPAEGITNSVLYSLKRYGIEVSDKNDLLKFIGPPLADSYMKYYGFNEEEAYRAVDVYREYFKDCGIFENKVYEGIPEMLQTLKTAGKRLIIATSKPEIFAKRILDHFNLTKYFDICVGSNLDGTRCKKDLVIAHAINIGNIKDLSTTIMIGDREHDVFGGKANGLKTIGVLYGYGDENELKSAGATYIVKDIKELTNLLIK